MPHKVVWFDLPVTDLTRAIEFYSKVLNAELQEEFPGVAVFSHSKDEVAGCLFLDQDCKPSASGALLYFNVDGRLDEAVDIAQRLGGTVEQPVHEIGPFGKRAVVLDSEGNRIALHSE